MFFSAKAKPKKLVILGGLAVFLSLVAVQPCPAMGDRPPRRAFELLTTTIRGQTRDKVTGKGLSGTLVELDSVTGQLIASVKTDEFGSYNIAVKAPTGSYAINASINGYKTGSVTSALYNGGSYLFNFDLKASGKNYPPQITSLSPQAHSSLIAGDTLKISITADDPDTDRLEYRYFLDNAVIQDWTLSAGFNLQTTAQDRGRHTVKVEVKDSQGSTDSRAMDIYIFRKFPKPSN